MGMRVRSYEIWSLLFVGSFVEMWCFGGVLFMVICTFFWYRKRWSTRREFKKVMEHMGWRVMKDVHEAMNV